MACEASSGPIAKQDLPSSGIAGGKILGYVKSRNEWPMLGLVVVNAMKLVDHVLVVDHASSDMTPAGLERLKQSWGDRITVIRLSDPAFFEEATSRVVMKACDVDRYDWVICFDSDEFLLAAPDFSLSRYLANVSSVVDAVRYEVHNWLSPTDINIQRLGDYTKSFQRALCSSSVGKEVDLVESVRTGQLNFFDLPFDSKLIARGKFAAQLTAGSHVLRCSRKVVETELPAVNMRCGHLPFYSKERLSVKARYGEYLVKSGHPAWFGWQSQVIYLIEKEGNFDDFWVAHSVHAQPRDSLFKHAHCCPDQALGQAIEGVLEQFDISAMTELHSGFNPGDSQLKQLNLDSVIRDVDELTAQLARKDQELEKLNRRLSSRLKSKVRSVFFGVANRAITPSS